MGFSEKPPILSGDNRQDLVKLRDYLFRMVQSLETASGADAAAEAGGLAVSYAKNGTQILKPGGSETDIDTVRRNANELKALIIKSANKLQEQIEAGDESVTQYFDQRLEAFDSYYLAKSEFGTFEENIDTRIETTARGVVESYDYDASIRSVQGDIGLLQNYYETIDGEIRRGIVLDPSTGNYVVGIAISQNMQFAGECGPTDPNNPGDGLTYYYIESGQTFGLYTSTGWQFWINGVKRGWFSSEDSMLHVSKIVVEEELQLGENWKITTVGGFGLRYVGS